ncbi:MAG: carboxypeptidase-like regulatory domain-containing protein [Bacteroidales bacterium]|nr:carboxypeptidase-like regulatory domain-containing protein [Bacteroidales bacterium]
MSTNNLTVTLLLLSLFVISPGSQAQENILEKKLHITIQDEPLYKALIRINQTTGYKFSYNSDILNEDQMVSLKVEGVSIRSCLDSLLSDSTLNYQVVDQHIVIHRKDQPPLARSSPSQPPTYISLNGKVMDRMTGNPLSYANIGVYNKSIGTISNEDGEFILKLHRRHLNDTLVVSYMGYKNRLIPIDQYPDSSVIKLEEKLYTIQEVIVRTFDADLIMNQALARIRENYYFEPITATGFYRESIKRKDKYTSVSEAVVDMYKPYNKIFQSPRIKILKSRKSTDVSRQDSITLKLKAGLEAVLLLDIVRENLSFFNSNSFQNYKYNVANISHFDDHNTYVVEFSPARKTEMTLYTGKLYIDVKTLALVSAEFHLNKENLSKIASSLIIKKKWDINVNPQSVHYYVSYRRIKDKYFLNQIRGDLSFKVRRRNQLFADDFQVTFDMFVSSVDTTRVSKFEHGEFFKPHKVFIEQVNDYDPLFWGEYNYIKPDEPIRETVSKLGSKINMLQEEE